MAAGDAGVNRVDLAARHQLGLFDGALDRLHRGLDIDHHAFFQAARRMHAKADHLQRAIGLQLTDNGDDLRRANIQPDHEPLIRLPRHGA